MATIILDKGMIKKGKVIASHAFSAYNKKGVFREVPNGRKQKRICP